MANKNKIYEYFVYCYEGDCSKMKSLLPNEEGLATMNDTKENAMSIIF